MSLELFSSVLISLLLFCKLFTSSVAHCKDFFSSVFSSFNSGSWVLRFQLEDKEPKACQASDLFLESEQRLSGRRLGQLGRHVSHMSGSLVLELLPL